MDLRGYEQAKFELSEILQAVVTAKAAEDQRPLQERLQDLLARLAEDRFNLVVAGRFSRGKSSLMNAILGMDRLPTGIVPLTSVITTVSYGTTERVTIKYQERRLDTEISLKELPQYVTQQGNPGNQRGIATANIELPAEILRRGFYFVDTPGLGSVITENTLTTKAYLPEADALLLVTGFESPISEEELGFLTVASQAKLPIFVAVNKQDLVSSAERDEAIGFVRSHLDGLYGQHREDVFSVSARDGLAAKLSHDATHLSESGLPALEERLVRFLLEQKRQVFLARMSARVEELLDDLPPFEGAPGLRRRVQALSNKYRSAPDDVEPSAPESLPAAFNRSQLRSCEICAAIENRIWDFLARYQYQLSTDHECQADFANRSGFCSYHTAEYERAASPFGTCSGYPPLLERVAALFRNAAKERVPDPRSVIVASLPAHDKCLLCAQRDKAETLAVSDVADRLRNNTTTALEKLSALCLPHLAMIADSLNDPKILHSLLDLHATVLERTAEDMRRFTLKQSAARRHLQTKEEQAAAQRGLLLLVGRRNANFSVGQIATSTSNFRCLPADSRRQDRA
ncbi:dynamin family protein [Bradyrhizobium sp.]|uniref:dynamin family protein n=1 Tax=Bradyrhizobium sp. TaxID=376 RepID=UPI00359FCBDB